MKAGLRAIAELGVVLAIMQAGVAQSPMVTLRGQVTDPSGAAVTKAIVSLVPAVGPLMTISTNGQGMFEMKAPPGKYTLDVRAPGFTLFEKSDVQLAAGQLQKLNVSLTIAVEKQRVEVSDQQPTVQANPAENASALVITGAALDALPDDPDELQSDLAALAGPAPGPNGGQIYIDGFTAGQLPPKSSIREIRINQNPFAPESDQLGYGKIEIFTKPGTDNLHGEFFVSGNDSAFNSRNPFAGVEPAYESTQYNGNIGGPLGKRASFFLSVQRRNTNDLSTTNAVVLNPNFDASPLSESTPNPQTRTNISPRLDYALSKNNTLTVHYQYYRNTDNNALADPFSLPSQAYDLASTEQMLQASDTQIIGSSMVNETRFQYLRDVENQNPMSVAPAVTVLQAFTGGGYTAGTLADRTNRYELQNYSSLLHSTHLVKFGIRLRAVQDSNISTAGFNGAFLFSSLTAYQAAEGALQSGATETTGASQFSITTGSSFAAISNYDVGLYAGDDWRIRPNLTLSYGLRFETQNDIHDHADFAPRLGIAWGLGGKNASPKTVLRAGAGVFYDRFKEDYILQAERLNGITQRQFIVSDPDFFPTVPQPSAFSVPNSVTKYEIDPALHAPYTLQSAVSIERQLGKIANLAVSYLNTRGSDQLISRNINAPLGATDPTRPLGNIGNIYQYASAGIFRQSQLITNVNVHTGPGLWLFGYYVLNYANSDTAGANSFPSNQYDLLADYGRAAFATRHSPSFGGTVALPYSLRLSPFFIISSGTPYNITLPYDLNGDSIFNDRPGFISAGTCPTVQITGSVYCTPLGTFDSVPRAGEKILPINYATGPGHFTVSVRLSKTIAFGRRRSEAGGGATVPSGDEKGHGGFGTAGGGLGLGNSRTRPYSVTFTLAARNVFNHVNLATPNGTLGSPLFGESNALLGGEYVGATAANRRIDLKASFNF